MLRSPPLSSSGKIESQPKSITPHIPTQPPSHLLFGDSVNKDPNALRVSSSSATIFPTFFTSFTTDTQQTWRPQPPLSTATAAANHQHNFNQDFLLFNEESKTLHPQVSLRRQATSNTHPNGIPSRHQSLNTARSQSINTGFTNNSNTHRSFSSPALYHPQHRQISRISQRPPVPLFPGNTQNQTRHIPTTGRSLSDPSSGRPLVLMTSEIMPSELDMFVGGAGASASLAGEGFDYDLFESQISNGDTISPHELMRSDSYAMSNPPSTAFPSLDTPDSGYLESPAMASSGLNTSPMDTLDSTLNFNELDTMAPLFPQNDFDQFGVQAYTANSSFTSINSNSASPIVRQKSSPGRPPAPHPVHGRKPSQSMGINKPKPRKDLPEIRIDGEDDKETAKRKKNTAAARKSRARKMEHAEARDTEIERLRAIIYRLGGNPDEDLD